MYDSRVDFDAWRCPKSKQPLVYFPRGEDDRDEGAAFFLCPASRTLRYRIDDRRSRYPFVIDEATEVAAAEVTRLLARARELGLRIP